jgi:hypothetical protein
MKLAEFLLNEIERPRPRAPRSLSGENGLPPEVPPIEPRADLAWVQGEELERTASDEAPRASPADA